MHEFRRIPIVTITIACITTTIYLLSLLNRDAMWANLSADWTLLYHQPWRVVTSPFLHHDFFQFLNNLVFLCLFGWQIEPRYGEIKTLGIFLGHVLWRNEFFQAFRQIAARLSNEYEKMPPMMQGQSAFPI